MSLMEDWEVLANQYNTDQATAQKFWTDYYMQEKTVYEKMLTEPVEVEKGTVAELAEKYGMDVVLKARRSDVMIHAHAEAARNTNSAADDNHCLSLNRGFYEYFKC